MMENAENKADSQDFIDAIELMFFAYRDFTAVPDEILQARGHGRAHHRVLHFVGSSPGMSIANLLDILRITKQSLARVLRDLIEGGYIEQRIGRNDRRKRLLFLTEKGRGLHAELMRPQSERFARVFSEAGSNAYSQWHNVMKLLLDKSK